VVKRVGPWVGCLIENDHSRSVSQHDHSRSARQQASKADYRESDRCQPYLDALESVAQISVHAPSLSPALAVLVAAAPGALARPEAPPQSLRIGQTRHLRRSAFAPAAPALVGLLFLGADNSELRSIIHFLCLAGTNKE
jgi:hypothetical protein